MSHFGRWCSFMTILALHVSQLIPGMIVAEDVFTARKERILSRNTIISQKHVMKLKLNCIKEIIVYIPKNLAEQQPTNDPDHVNKLKSSIEYKKFKKYYSESINLLKSSFMGVLGFTNDEFNTVSLLNQVDGLLKECRSSLRTFDMLQCMREFDDMVYVHSLNVTLICASSASRLNFTPEEHTVGVCGLQGLRHVSPLTKKTLRSHQDTTRYTV